MKNKKKLILIGVSSVFVIILGIGLYLWFGKDNDPQVYENNKEEVKEQISGFNGISMMYETGPGTGEYSESKSSLWPEDGYIFNDTLSGCENGGELSWNEEKKAVILNSLGSDACYVYFDAYIIPVINSVSTSNIETDSITLTVNVTNGNNPVSTYYYSKDNGSSYETSNSNTYTFSGLDMGTVYNFSVYVEDSAGYKSEVYTLSETTEDMPTFADTCRETGSNTLACHVATQYTTDGENGLYYHDADLENGAGDNSYRYSGANPNNYVCFGSNASTCPSDNLYRIIGVFGSEVKLIKSTSYGNYNWSGSSSNTSNTWSSSTLNTSTLNRTYLNNLGSAWSNLIANHSWKVGGITTSQRSNQASIVYGYEVGSNSCQTSSTDCVYPAKIGLMYISDYGFAASTANWTTALNNTSISTNNWMYLDSYEWTISRSSDYSDYAFPVYSTGLVGNTYVYFDFAVRPSFYLNSSVNYVSGSGSSADPIRLS